MSATLLWNTLLVQLKASPSKAATLGVLLLVLTVVVAGQLVGGPRSAEAAPDVSNLPSFVAEPAPLPPRDSRPPAPDLHGTPTRDLFSTNWSGFAPVPAAQLSTDVSNPAGQTKPAPRWVLELTLTHPTSTEQHFAVINGTRVKVGDKILGLAVDTIAPGTVILVGEKKERIVLQMN